MAASYGLRFYGNYTLRESGVTVTLQVWKRGYNSNTFYLGGLQGLSLEIGGGNDPIYTPVVKTTLRFTLADGFDIGHTIGSGSNTEYAIDNEGGVLTKHGRWEEFYTEDPTLYKIQLLIGSNVIWKGFITPDSWEESMVYHGSIVVTARDMLGTLSDVPFSLEGNAKYVTVENLIRQAVAASQGEMELSFNSSRVPVNSEASISLLQAQISAKAFEGQTWWDALTKTLESLGLVMRYNGRNIWSVASLRFLPYEIGALSTLHDCEFINLSGVRTLDPPVRDIDGTFTVEDQDYDLEPPKPADLEEAGMIDILDGTDRQDLELMSYAPSTPSGSFAVPAGGQSILYKPTLPPDDSLFEAGFTDFAPLYFLANRIAHTGYEYANVPLITDAVKAPVKLRIRQDGLMLTTDGVKMYPVIPVSSNPPAIDKVTLHITAQAGDTTLYLGTTGEWFELPVDCFVEFNHGTEATVNIPAPEDVVIDSYNVNIVDLDVDGRHNYHPTGATADRTGYIVPLAFSLSYPDGVSVAKEYNVNTIYNANYNVRITRTPALGCIDAQLSSDFLSNVLLDSNRNPLPDSWEWSSGSGEDLPLEVLVQMQVLQYYASALSIFTGSLHDKLLPVPGAAFTYFGRNCVLLRGTYDFATNFIQDVCLREYYSWEQVWGQVTPSWSRQTKGTTGSGGSGGSSGGSGGGASSQMPYANAEAIAELRTRVADLESFWQKDANTNIFAKNQKGVYSYSFIAAGGLGQGSGGGGGGDVTLTVESGVANLTVAGTLATFYTKDYLDSHLGTAAAKDVGAVALNNSGLVTGDAVQRAINDAISGAGTPVGWGTTDNQQYADLWVGIQAATKRLSLATHNHSSLYYTKTQVDNAIAGIAVGEMNVQSDWAENDTYSDAYIRNKPTGIALLDANQTFTGNNTFTLEVSAAGYKVDGQNALLAYTDQGVKSALLVGYGSCADRPIQYYAKTSHTFSVYKAGLQDPTWNPVLALQDTAIYAYRNIEPASNATLDIGSALLAWNRAFVKRWYPRQNDTSIYVEYDALADAFIFHGNVISTGFVTAGEANPNA